MASQQTTTWLNKHRPPLRKEAEPSTKAHTHNRQDVPKPGLHGLDLRSVLDAGKRAQDIRSSWSTSRRQPDVKQPNVKESSGKPLKKESNIPIPTHGSQLLLNRHLRRLVRDPVFSCPRPDDRVMSKNRSRTSIPRSRKTTLNVANRLEILYLVQSSNNTSRWICCSSCTGKRSM